MLKPYFIALRPHQWVKNTLVALPSVADHAFHPRPILVAFWCFSMAASAVYLFNDCLDAEHDKTHPQKCHRPIAAGQIGTANASAAGIIIATLSLSTACFFSYRLALAVGGYTVLALTYSLFFKRFIMLDVIVLATLYGMRIVGGAVAIGLVPSPWLIALCFFLFLSLGLMKRVTEIVNAGTLSGRGYTPDDLPTLNALCVACGLVSVLVLGLYINSVEVMAFYRTPQLLWGICAVLAGWVGRACLIAARGDMHHDPVIFACTDTGSLVAGVLVVGLYIASSV